MLAGLRINVVKVRETSVRTSRKETMRSLWPFPKKRTPYDLVVDGKQMANFLSNPKAAENREVSPIPYPPRPAMPFTPLERLAKRDVSPQPKGRLGTETVLVGLDPSAECLNGSPKPRLEEAYRRLCLR